MCIRDRRYNLGGGHAFLPADKLTAATASLLGLDAETIEAGMQRLLEQGRMDEDTVAGLRACYLPEFYEAEQYVAARVAQMARVRIEPPRRLAQILAGVEEKHKIAYAQQQKQAIADAAECRLLLVTGGPGTGKTTVMTGILDLFDAMGLKTQDVYKRQVQSVIYQNPENGYAVLRLLTEAGEVITLVGTIPMTLAGERLIVTGRWGHHASYGRQFEAEFLERLMPETTDEIFSYLSSGAVKGIGEKTAAKILELFGAQALDVLENTPEELVKIAGISRRKALEIGESFRRQSGVRRLIEFLTLHLSLIHI